MISVSQVAHGAGILVVTFLLMFLGRSSGSAITGDDLDLMLGFLAGMGGLFGYRALRAGQLAPNTARKIALAYAVAVALRYLLF